MRNASITSVASAFDLDDLDRASFICDISDPTTDIYKAYHSGLSMAEGDIDLALQNLAVTADVDAARLIYERNCQAAVDEMKKELFGI